MGLCDSRAGQQVIAITGYEQDQVIKEEGKPDKSVPIYWAYVRSPSPLAMITRDGGGAGRTGAGQAWRGVAWRGVAWRSGAGRDRTGRHALASLLVRCTEPPLRGLAQG